MAAGNTPVGILLAALEPRANRRIEQSASAQNACKALEGKSFALNIEGLSLRVLCRVFEGQLKFDKDMETAADAEMSGGPFSLMRLLEEDPQAVLREGAVTLNGDTDIANDFDLLFKFIKPDLEEIFAEYFEPLGISKGAARQAGLMLEELGDWLKGVKVSLGRSTADYLQEESRDVPSRTEAEEFNEEVDALAQAADRFEAKLKNSRLNKDRSGLEESADAQS